MRGCPHLILVGVVSLVASSPSLGAPTLRELRSRVVEAPGDVRSRYLLGQRLFLLHRFREALTQWGAVVADHPTAWSVHNRIGVAWYRLGGTANLRRALLTWRRVLRSDPDNPYAEAAYAKVLPRYRALVERRGPSTVAEPVETALDQGLRLFAAGAFDEALKALDGAAKVPEQRREALHHVALCHLEREDGAAAAASFRTYVSEFGDDARSYEGLALALGLQGKLDEQAECLERCILLAPDDPEPHFRLLMVRDRQGNLQEALKQAREVLRLDGSYKSRLLAYLKVGGGGGLGQLVNRILDATADGPPSETEIEDMVTKARTILGDDDQGLDGAGLKVRLKKLE